ncbi:phosphoribosylglycinamide formyltransferase [Micrococcales bacterium 31B]|nr:phosphoribosylglycinamide formyltransferase [Micrococcales bacterium 31B]
MSLSFPALATAGPARVVVLISGSGSNLLALLEAARSEGSPLEIVAVVADRDCSGLQHALDYGVPTHVINFADFASRDAWDASLLTCITAAEPDLIVCAGFMRVIGPELPELYRGAIINTHPALLPAFPGAHGARDALTHGVKVSGVTVHVVDAGLDTGPILAQAAVPVLRDDTPDTLQERIKGVERELLVNTVAAVAVHGYSLEGRVAHLNLPTA